MAPPELLPAAARLSFPPERLEMIRAVEEGHFWFHSRHKLLVQTLSHYRPVPAEILDVGCGSGRWGRQLTELGYRVTGTDIWPDPPRGFTVETYRLGTAEALPWPEASCDGVTLLDTLEHVDDAAALREAGRVLRPGGILLASVPAFPALWSARDVQAGHRRRYTRRALAAKLVAAGFEPGRIFGYQFLLLPLVWSSRWLSRFRATQLTDEERPVRWLNGLLRAVNEFEIVAGRVVRPPVGSSLIVIARKRSPR